MVKGDSGRAQKEIQRAVEKATIFLEYTWEYCWKYDSEGHSGEISDRNEVISWKLEEGQFLLSSGKELGWIVHVLVFCSSFHIPNWSCASRLHLSSILHIAARMTVPNWIVRLSASEPWATLHCHYCQTLSMTLPWSCALVSSLSISLNVFLVILLFWITSQNASRYLMSLRLWSCCFLS